VAKIKHLNSIAFDIAHSFESRNNSTRGQWALGPLLSHALKEDVISVKFDLLAKTITPSSLTFIYVIKQYSKMLEKQLLAKGIEKSYISSANITVNFDYTLQRISPLVTRFTETKFSIEVSISTTERTFIKYSYGWCFPS